MMQPGKSYLAQIYVDGTVFLPSEVVEQLGVREGDSLTFSHDPSKPELGMTVTKAPPGPAES